MKKRLKQMLPVCIIVIVTVIMSIILYDTVVAREAKRCWQLLGESAESVSQEIAMKFEDEIVKLRLAAEIIVEEDLMEVEQLGLLHLEKFEATTIFSRIDILYPDNTVLMENGRRQVLQTEASFEELAVKGEHISARRKDFDTGRECVYYCIPLTVANETAAILIGVIDAKSLSEIFTPTIYQGQANCCIIDSEDGNFIMDNWHEELGNSYEMETRKRLRGYENIDLKEENMNHRTGVIVFESQTTGLPLYMYYMPMDIFDWQFLVFVQEEIAFADVLYLKKVLAIAGIIEALLLIFYFWFNFWKVNQLEKSKEETEWQLENSSILIQCVTELSADTDIQISINNLLEIITQHYNADRTYIYEVDLEQDTLVNTYESVKTGIVPLINAFQEKHILDLKEWMENYKKLPDREFTGSIKLEKPGVHRCRVVPLCKNNTIIGFMGIDNAEKHRDEMSVLYSIQYFITNAILRQKKQEQLKYMSYQDMLTSLYNRNKYIQLLESSAGQRLDKIGVVYIDLNGLKQINDTQSHEMGDVYIRNAAGAVSQFFAEQSYRIGGDEFVVLAQPVNQEVFLDKTAQMQAAMEENQISVSVGILWRETCENLEMLVKEAETKMYEDKKRYYQTHDRYLSRD